MAIISPRDDFYGYSQRVVRYPGHDCLNGLIITRRNVPSMRPRLPTMIYILTYYGDLMTRFNMLDFADGDIAIEFHYYL